MAGRGIIGVARNTGIVRREGVQCWPGTQLRGYGIGLWVRYPPRYWGTYVLVAVQPRCRQFSDALRQSRSAEFTLILKASVDYSDASEI